MRQQKQIRRTHVNYSLSTINSKCALLWVHKRKAPATRFCHPIAKLFAVLDIQATAIHGAYLATIDVVDSF